MKFRYIILFSAFVTAIGCQKSESPTLPGVGTTNVVGYIQLKPLETGTIPITLMDQDMVVQPGKKEATWTVGVFCRAEGVVTLGFQGYGPVDGSGSRLKFLIADNNILVAPTNYKLKLNKTPLGLYYGEFIVHVQTLRTTGTSFEADCVVDLKVVLTSPQLTGVALADRAVRLQFD